MSSKANKKEFVFSHLGDISVNKGWDKEIEAFSMLRKKYKERNIKFYYAGKICHMSDTDIKNKVNECGLEENDTKYLGFINNIKETQKIKNSNISNNTVNKIYKNKQKILNN